LLPSGTRKNPGKVQGCLVVAVDGHTLMPTAEWQKPPVVVIIAELQLFLCEGKQREKPLY
jgi:hypothetical protein